MEATSKTIENMRVLKLRDFWDKTDDTLVYNDKLTKAGISAYWRSLDASFQFNVHKRGDFLIRSKFRSLKVKGSEELRSNQLKKTDKEDLEDDGVPRFFAKYKQRVDRDSDRFHWHRSQVNNRFMLPRLKKP